MSDTNIPFQLLKDLRGKCLIDKSHVLGAEYLALGSTGITDCDTAAFLSSVLKRK